MLSILQWTLSVCLHSVLLLDQMVAKKMGTKRKIISLASQVKVWTNKVGDDREGKEAEAISEPNVTMNSLYLR